MTLEKPQYVENVTCAELTRKDILKLLQSKILKQMISLCSRKNGIGLAAIQVGIRKKFFVAFRPDTKVKGQVNMGNWCVFINAEYKFKGKEIYQVEEGCLTYGKDTYLVTRHKKIIASWDEIDSSDNVKRVKQELDGLFAQVFQHECDHLNNITINRIGKKVGGNNGT